MIDSREGGRPARAYIQGGLGRDTERRLEELAPLLTLASRHSEAAEARLREICTTHPDYAVAYWKLLDIWRDFAGQDLAGPS